MPNWSEQNMQLNGALIKAEQEGDQRAVAVLREQLRHHQAQMSGASQQTSTSAASPGAQGQQQPNGQWAPSAQQLTDAINNPKHRKHLGATPIPHWNSLATLKSIQPIVDAIPDNMPREQVITHLL